MTTLSRIRVRWTGPAVTGPGVSTFYTLGSPASAVTALKAFFTDVANQCPNGVTWNVDTGGETIDDNTGEVNGAWTGGSGGSIVGASGLGFAAGVGCRVVWQTAGITHGRRVRGATYIVPLAGPVYQSDGTIVNAAVIALESAASTLLAALPDELVILTRQSVTTSGTSHAITGSSVPDKVSWLRTRRT